MEIVGLNEWWGQVDGSPLDPVNPGMLFMHLDFSEVVKKFLEDYFSLDYDLCIKYLPENRENFDIEKLNDLEEFKDFYKKAIKKFAEIVYQWMRDMIDKTEYDVKNREVYLKDCLLWKMYNEKEWTKKKKEMIKKFLENFINKDFNENFPNINLIGEYLLRIGVDIKSKEYDKIISGGGTNLKYAFLDKICNEINLEEDLVYIVQRNVNYVYLYKFLKIFGDFAKELFEHSEDKDTVVWILSIIYDKKQDEWTVFVANNKVSKKWGEEMDESFFELINREINKLDKVGNLSNENNSKLLVDLYNCNKDKVFTSVKDFILKKLLECCEESIVWIDLNKKDVESINTEVRQNKDYEDLSIYLWYIGGSKLNLLKEEFKKWKIEYYKDKFRKCFERNGAMPSYDLQIILNIFMWLLNVISNYKIDLSNEFKEYVREYIEKNYDNYLRKRKERQLWWEMSSFNVKKTLTNGPKWCGESLTPEEKNLKESLSEEFVEDFEGIFGNMPEELKKYLETLLSKWWIYKKEWFEVRFPNLNISRDVFFSFIEEHGFKLYDFGTVWLKLKWCNGFNGFNDIKSTSINEKDSPNEEKLNKLRELISDIKVTKNVEEEIELIVKWFELLYSFSSITSDEFKDELLKIKSDKVVIKKIKNIFDLILGWKTEIPKPYNKKGWVYYVWEVWLKYRIVIEIIEWKKCITFFWHHDEYDVYTKWFK